MYLIAWKNEICDTIASPHSQHFFLINVEKQCWGLVFYLPLLLFMKITEDNSILCLIPHCVFLLSTLRIHQKVLPCKSDPISISISSASSVFHFSPMKLNGRGASAVAQLQPSLPLWRLLEKQDVSEIPTGFNHMPDKSLGEDVLAHNFRGRVVFEKRADFIVLLWHVTESFV